MARLYVLCTGVELVLGAFPSEQGMPGCLLSELLMPPVWLRAQQVLQGHMGTCQHHASAAPVRAGMAG